MISRNVFDEGYAMHCLLNESFGERAPKPFRMITYRAAGRVDLSDSVWLARGPLRLRRCRGRCLAGSVDSYMPTHCNAAALQVDGLKSKPYARQMETRTAAWLRGVGPADDSPLKESCQLSGHGVGCFPVGSDPA